MKKSIEVKEQVRLSPLKCAELVLSGVKYRLFRAAITVVIISLAGAFLMTMLTESLIAREVADTVRTQTYDRDMFLFWYDRLSSPISQQQLSEELAGLRPGRNRWKELKFWGDLSEEEMNTLKDVAVRQELYLDYFDKLSEGRRRPLVGSARGDDIFERFRDEQKLTDFEKRLAGSDRPFPTDTEKFRRFLGDWQATKPLRSAIREGHRKALQAVRALCGDESLKELLAEGDTSLLSKLARHGFRMPPEELQIVRGQARINLDAQRIQAMVRVSEVKKELSLRLGKSLVDVNELMLLKEIRSKKGAQWFLDLTRRVGQPLEMSAERVRQVARNVLHMSELSEIESTVSLAAGVGGFLGFSDRTLWLLIVSFLVCIVGIANAMLMSVTERFREIATMKCLGATDGFIMINFILESCLQGTVGGAVGTALGLLLGSLHTWGIYGFIAIEGIPWGDVAAAAGFAWVVSVLISATAAVYPAWVAARLAPMEAMRIE